jgi:hypothetical protein
MMSIHAESNILEVMNAIRVSCGLKVRAAQRTGSVFMRNKPSVGARFETGDEAVSLWIWAHVNSWNAGLTVNRHGHLARAEKFRPRLSPSKDVAKNRRLRLEWPEPSDDHSMVVHVERQTESVYEPFSQSDLDAIVDVLCTISTCIRQT